MGRRLGGFLVAVGATLAISSLILLVIGPENLSSPLRILNLSEASVTLDRMASSMMIVAPDGDAFLDDEPSNDSDETYRMRLAEEKSSLDVRVQNRYTLVSPLQTGRRNTYPWRYVAEPFRKTTLTASEGRENAWYKWVIDGHDHGYGSSVDVAWTSLGWKRVALIEKVNGTTTCVVAVKVMVKYVRREIRTLADRDRETFFQAVMIMQRVPTEVGTRLYGNKYRSKDYFNRIHLYYGGTKDCDHWHQGAGFVTSHMAFTLEFEQSTQSISPDISIPYWDFTIESTFYDPKTWRSSPVFADDWFGAAAPANPLRTVVRGRWAFVRAMTRSQNFSDIYNSYGVLRAPWNNDPTPFMTRHNKIYGFENNMKPSGCKEYAFAMKKTTWMAMSRQLNSAAHGHIHETVGGSWNHDVDDANEVDPAVFTFAHEIQALSKELWRADYVVCPVFCTMDTPWRDCQCQCTPRSRTDAPSYRVLDDAGVLSAVHYYDHDHHQIEKWKDLNGTVLHRLPGYTTEESNHIYDELLDILCSPGHIGDMFQATSTNDITFWVLHPTVDRLWHFKRLGKSGDFDETWDPYHSCYGHNPTDIQPFKNLFDSNDAFYTNEDLYEYLRPDSDGLPYMYDNFRWPHCEKIGITLSNEP
ncbi:hypothetical protein CTAYLR_008385 [Chrysophaeum taylorii]|uniref:Tyrosinase copper-binding domain-containing protein n=1 Tax=Chrysophaeum taylorii TaxID=2483200 RepID=A0AAD7UHF1_9STRA|nr:hypothetical protein CTAYLR_008385 [Chrysophaeum taylorii]